MTADRLSAVFAMELPPHEKLIAIFLSENADQDGFVSQRGLRSKLARFAGISPAAVDVAIDRLRARGVIHLRANKLLLWRR